MTRGDISKVELSKEDSIIGFDIIFKSGDTWHLRAETNVRSLCNHIISYQNCFINVYLGGEIGLDKNVEA